MAKRNTQIPQNITYAQAERLINSVEALTRALAAKPNNYNEQEDYDAATFRMFAELNEVKLPRSTQEFISSLEEQFDETGTLSRKQFLCLKDNYNKFVHNIPFTR